MVKFVVIRNIIILTLGIWYFEFYLDYKLPESNNQLLFFVAIPIIWSTICQLWTSFSYKDLKGKPSVFFTHVLSVMMFASTVFLVSAVLNTLSDILDPIGVLMFHAVGWTAILAIIMYDVVDSTK